MENKEFDKLIASKLSEKKYSVSADAWERLEKELRVTRKVTSVKWRWAAAVSMIIGIGVIYQLNKTDFSIIDTENIPFSTTEEPNIIPYETEKNSLQPERAVVAADVALPLKNDEYKQPHNPVKQANALSEIAVLQTPQHKNPNDNITEIPIENLAFTSESNLYAEQDYTQLVMSKLKRTQIKVEIDASDLLKITEQDLQNTTNKTLRQLAIQKFKNTVHDLHIALND